MQNWLPRILFLTLLCLLFLAPAPASAVSPIDLTFAVPGVAVIIAIFLALCYMLSASISDPRFDAWAKTELHEFAGALVLIVLVILFFIGSNGIGVALTGQADYTNYSMGVIDGWLSNYDSAFTNIIGAATRLRTSATYAPYLNIPLWYISLNYSTSPLAGIGILFSALNVAVQGLTNITFMLEGIRMLLPFLKVTGPKVLLPLAFILRLIPFTRKTGNTLIALSIAGMIFLPFSVILAQALNSQITIPQPTIHLSNLDANPAAMVMMQPECEAIPVRILLGMTDVLFAVIVCIPAGPFFGVCYPVVKEVVYPIINTVYQLATSAVLIIWEAVYFFGGSKEYTETVFNTLWPFLRDVNNLVLLGHLDFIVIVLVTVAGARSISTALGGEWYLAGLQRLI